MAFILTHYKKIILIIILILAAFLRFYKLGIIPPSISWDEAAVGYNAYTISHWGKDEWGKTLPFYFKSFEDDKNPIHVYLTAVSVGILGLNEFSTRLPMAIFGVLNVLLIYILAKLAFKSSGLGLIASFFLSISPYNLQFSRFNHEANVALFFFMLGLVIFYWCLNSKRNYWALSFLSFGLSIFSYHSAKVVVPFMIIILMILYFKQLWQVKKQVLLSSIVFLVFGLIVFLNPALLGSARMNQASIPQDILEKTEVFEKTNSLVLAKLDLSWQRYQTYFSKEYLFISGDPNGRHSIRTIGEFFKVDALFLIIGLISLIWRRKKESAVLLSWGLLAPIPASVAGGMSEISHSARALFTMGSWHIVSAYGLYSILNLVKRPWLKIFVLSLTIVALSFQFKTYLMDYYTSYSNQFAIDWQYGMKQIAEYVEDRNGYFKVYMTDIRSQPYIFLLYYLKASLPEYLKTTTLNPDLEKRKYSLISSFDKYHFGNWDPTESKLEPGVLYIVTPGQYDGMRNRDMFDIKNIIKYPNGGNAYYLVSYP